MILLFVLLILVLFILYCWISTIRQSRRFNVPGPFPLPVVGNAHLFIVKSTEFLNLLKRLSQKYGDVYRVQLLSVPYIIMSDPKYVEPLLSSTEHIKKGKVYNFFLPWLGEGLITATGQKWKSHRKFLTPAFHFNMLQIFLPVFYKNQRVLTEKLLKMADGRSIDLFPLVALAALDNVTESIMGMSVEAQTHSGSEYVQSNDGLSKIIAARIQIPFLAEDAIFNLLPMKRRHDKYVRYLHAHTDKVIKARREQLKKANITSLASSNDVGIKNKHAFLDLLLLGDTNGEKFDETSVREEVNTFMFAGHDTTTSGICYSLLCLSRHRDVQDKIYAELETIFGDDMDREPTYNELNQMRYLDMVIKESMRLYPPVPFFGRDIMRDCQIGDVKLVKGTSVLMNIYQIMRHPDYYDDPLEFRPERFADQLKHSFSWIPFSAGPRNCIGQKFAMMELKVAISEMVKNFIILPHDEEPQLCADLVLRSVNGVKIKLKKREKSL